MKNTITRTDIDTLLANSEIDVCTKFEKVTVVTVKLPNGFVLVEASGAVDKANYNEAIGRAVCLDRIAQKLWSFEGYNLSTQRAAKSALAEELLNLCWAIEKIPPGTEQSAASIRAADLRNRVASS